MQETRQRRNKAKELGDGYKLFYSGTYQQGRNGIGIILSKELKENIAGINRRSDKVMSVKLSLKDMVINIICMYAPQVGCSEEEKEKFWEQMDQELSGTLEGERVVVGGDLR